MNLSKMTIYGLVFTLHIARTGRATVEKVAETQKLSVAFLARVCAKLKKAGIVESVRGPGGGYELNPKATMFDVMIATGFKPLLSKRDVESFQQSPSVEFRAISFYIQSFESMLLDTLRDEVIDVMQAYDSHEEGVLDLASEEGNN